MTALLMAGCIAALVAGLTVRAEDAAPATSPARDYPVKPVPFTAVRLSDTFWAPRIEANRTVSIPMAFKKCEETGRIQLFERAAAVLAGRKDVDKTAPGFPFDDSDVYKVIEGAAYALSVQPDPKLEAYVDALAARIAAAQEPDGYLYCTRTINPEHPHEWAGKQRWENESGGSHELYNLGHLYEASVAYYQATGKRQLLDVSIKSANLLDQTFGPGKQSTWPGHQIIEMGLVKLYRVTGDERYLKLAKFFLDERSKGHKGSEYSQSHKPVTEQTEAVGHAVRAAYMYAGMADVAALTGDESYLKAIDAIWGNAVAGKLYITGGIGARHGSEAFGDSYELPNLTAYNETCASIANVYWNQRLFLLHEDAKYIDVMERTLYNALLSGVALDGKTYFYPNPLESGGEHARSPWFGCACCPSNVTRFMASLPGYVYAQQGNRLFVNLFAAGAATVAMDNGQKVQLTQETRYPWDGTVRISVDPQVAGRFSLLVRIPGWAREQVVPSELYRYSSSGSAAPTLQVNGEPVKLDVQKGYVAIDRTWRKGDVVELNLPMPVREIVADDHVAADRGRVAIERGPVVYCFEWPDNPRYFRLMALDASSPLKEQYRADLLGGVVTIQARGALRQQQPDGSVSTQHVELCAIPYYAWANRGKGDMIVWMSSREEAATILPMPAVASESRVSVSAGENASAINSLSEPKNSDDHSRTYYHCWPRKGSSEWVQYTFAHEATVSEAGLYWFDDTGHGECRVPAEWRLLYLDGEQWKPVKAQGPYGTARDTYNTVHFEPVTTSAMRLEFQSQKGWASGIQKWNLK